MNKTLSLLVLAVAFFILASCDKKEDKNDEELGFSYDYTSTMRKYAEAPEVGNFICLPLENNDNP